MICLEWQCKDFHVDNNQCITQLPIQLTLSPPQFPHPSTSKKKVGINWRLHRLAYGLQVPIEVVTNDASLDRLCLLLPFFSFLQTKRRWREEMKKKEKYDNSEERQLHPLQWHPPPHYTHSFHLLNILPRWQKSVQTHCHSRFGL